MNGFVYSISGLFFVILMITSIWRVFEKAGRHGWESLIPVYNLYQLVKISGKSGAWMFLLLIPFVNIIAILALHMNIANRFGESSLFGLGMIFFPYLFWPILGFGDSVYQGFVPGNKTDGAPSTFVNESGETVEEIPLEDW